MYLCRPRLIGSHDEASRYLLQSRGLQQLSDKPSFNFWGMTQHCLQGRQLLATQRSPDASLLEQNQSYDNQNTDVQMLADASEIARLCTTVRDLEQTMQSRSSGSNLDMHLHEAEKLKVRIQETIRKSEGRFDGQRRSHDDLIRLVGEAGLQTRSLVGQVPQENQNGRKWRVGRHGDFSENQTVWLALLWSFYAAFQISLREALISTTRMCCADDGCEEQLEALKHEEDVINSLASDMLDFAVPIMECQRGAMSARASLIFGLTGLKNARYIITTTRKLASVRQERLRAQHKLH